MEQQAFLGWSDFFLGGPTVHTVYISQRLHGERHMQQVKPAAEHPGTRQTSKQEAKPARAACHVMAVRGAASTVHRQTAQQVTWSQLRKPRA